MGPFRRRLKDEMRSQRQQAKAFPEHFPSLSRTTTSFTIELASLKEVTSLNAQIFQPEPDLSSKRKGTLSFTRGRKADYLVFGIERATNEDALVWHRNSCQYFTFPPHDITGIMRTRHPISLDA